MGAKVWMHFQNAVLYWTFILELYQFCCKLNSLLVLLNSIIIISIWIRRVLFFILYGVEDISSGCFTYFSKVLLFHLLVDTIHLQHYCVFWRNFGYIAIALILLNNFLAQLFWNLFFPSPALNAVALNPFIIFLLVLFSGVSFCLCRHVLEFFIWISKSLILCSIGYHACTEHCKGWFVECIIIFLCLCHVFDSNLIVMISAEFSFGLSWFIFSESYIFLFLRAFFLLGLLLCDICTISLSRRYYSYC